VCLNLVRRLTLDVHPCPLIILAERREASLDLAGACRYSQVRRESEVWEAKGRIRQLEGGVECHT
jgi:hypothetical protein